MADLSPLAQFNFLADELAVFLQEQRFAITSQNWEYLAELLHKQQGHFARLTALAPQLDWSSAPLRAKVAALQAAEHEAAALMQSPLAANRQEYAQLQAAFKRLAALRAYADQGEASPPARGSLKAHA
jgi:hypothetical protein